MKNPRNKWYRPLCWIVGHRWCSFRISPEKHMNLLHLHPMAGVDAVCQRCGEQWLDAEDYLGIFNPPRRIYTMEEAKR